MSDMSIQLARAISSEGSEVFGRQVWTCFSSMVGEEYTY